MKEDGRAFGCCPSNLASSLALSISIHTVVWLTVTRLSMFLTNSYRFEMQAPAIPLPNPWLVLQLILCLGCFSFPLCTWTSS
jgi:hypothetical protein